MIYIILFFFLDPLPQQSSPYFIYFLFYFNMCLCKFNLSYFLIFSNKSGCYFKYSSLLLLTLTLSTYLSNFLLKIYDKLSQLFSSYINNRFNIISFISLSKYVLLRSIVIMLVMLKSL